MADPAKRLFALELTSPVSRVLVRIAGGVLSWAGVALLVVFAWALFAALIHPEVITRTWVVLCGLLLVSGAFSAIVGFRMFLNRPNPQGSILSPAGWIALAAAFAIAAAFIAATALRTRAQPAAVINAVGGCIAFALMSLYMARRTRRKGRP